MTTDFRAQCAELLAAIQLYTGLNPAASEMSSVEITEKLMDVMAATTAALATSPPEDNTKPGFINVCVEGPPPAPYENWEDWLVDTFKNRTIKGVCIRALISGDFSFDKKEVATPPPEPLTDEEIMGLMPQQMHEDLATAVRAMAEQEGIDSTPAKGIMRIILNRHIVDLVRAAIERWGK